MTRRAVTSVVLALSLALPLTACGGSKEDASAKSWAGTLCSSSADLKTALGQSFDALSSAKKQSSPSQMKSTISGPTGKVQAAIEGLDTAFSQDDIPGTPLEAARNSLGKQLTQVFPLYDAIDQANSALDDATDAAAGGRALDTLAESFSQGVSSVASLRVAIAAFKTSTDEVVKKAFTSAPECKVVD